MLVSLWAIIEQLWPKLSTLWAFIGISGEFGRVKGYKQLQPFISFGIKFKSI